MWYLGNQVPCVAQINYRVNQHIAAAWEQRAVGDAGCPCPHPCPQAGTSSGNSSVTSPLWQDAQASGYSKWLNIHYLKWLLQLKVDSKAGKKSKHNITKAIRHFIVNVCMKSGGFISWLLSQAYFITVFSMCQTISSTYSENCHVCSSCFLMKKQIIAGVGWAHSSNGSNKWLF